MWNVIHGNNPTERRPLWRVLVSFSSLFLVWRPITSLSLIDLINFISSHSRQLFSVKTPTANRESKLVNIVEHKAAKEIFPLGAGGDPIRGNTFLCWPEIWLEINSNVSVSKLKYVNVLSPSGQTNLPMQGEKIHFILIVILSVCVCKYLSAHLRVACFYSKILLFSLPVNIFDDSSCLLTLLAHGL